MNVFTKKTYKLVIISLSLVFLTSLSKPQLATAGCTTDPNYSDEGWDFCGGQFWQIGCNIAYTQGMYTYYTKITNTGIYCQGGGPLLNLHQYRCDGGSTPCGSVGSCFTGDTKISTPDGEKEIKDIKEGDVVKSFDPETGKITLLYGYRPVQQS